MATFTITKGYNPPDGFTSGEVVTPEKLNSAQTPVVAISDLAVSDMAAATIERLLPAGAVMPFAMASAPSGWLAANGAAVSRSTYADLFSAIGTTHGAGDGSTTFNLPDLRGIFVRGSGSQTIGSSTYSATLGTKQEDEIKSHTHTHKWGTTVASSSGSYFNAQAANNSGTTDNTGATGGTETRPANIALLYCIKF